MTESIDQADIKPLEQVSVALDAGVMQPVRRMMNSLHSAEVANLLESLPPTQREVVWNLLETTDQGDVLVELAEEVRNGLIEGMDTQSLVAATEGMEMDDLADFIQDLPDTMTNQVLQLMDNQDRERVQSILKYDEHTAGGLMNTDTVTVREDVSLDVVLRYLHQRGELPAHTDSLFVVDRNELYQGSLSLAALVTSDPTLTVTDVINPDVPVFDVDMSSWDVAKIFENRDLYTAAAIDADGKLVGRITIDDVVDVIREEADKEILSRVGLSDEDDIFSPVIPSTRRRAVWLGLNLATALIASWVIGNFQGTLEKLVALAVLMPVVASMGGIAGTQTMTMVIRGMALDQIGKSNFRWLLAKEIMVGILNGLIWATVVAAVTFLWFKDGQLSLIIAIAMLANQVIASFCGVTVPMFLQRINIDPALAGGVVLTTITDVAGFVIFLGLATLVLV